MEVSISFIVIIVIFNFDLVCDGAKKDLFTEFYPIFLWNVYVFLIENEEHSKNLKNCVLAWLALGWVNWRPYLIELSIRIFICSIDNFKQILIKSFLIKHKTNILCWFGNSQNLNQSCHLEAPWLFTFQLINWFCWPKQKQ